MTSFHVEGELPEASKDISRREFVSRVGGVFVGGVLLTNGITPATTGSSLSPSAVALQRNMHTLNQEMFSGHLDETFRVRNGSSDGIDVVLSNIQDLSSGKYGECFSILFRGPLGRCLDQGTYLFEHDTIGAFDLFIVPMAQDHDAHVQVYEAVFNRLHT